MATYPEHMKVCRRCQTPKDRDTEFGNNKTQKDGKHWNCKPCSKIASKESRLRKKERLETRAAENLQDKMRHLKPAERHMAEELLKPDPKHVDEDRAYLDRVYSPDSCKVYVKRLREQRQRQQTSFPTMTANSLLVWEQRLIKIIGQKAFDQFIFEECN